MKTVKKAFEILQLLSRDPEYAYPLREIADSLLINISTCNLLLKSLVEIGAAEQKFSRQGYSLGPLLYQLTANGPYKKNVMFAADRFLHDFLSETGETIILSTYHKNLKKRVVMCVLQGNQAVQIRQDLLSHDDLYNSASGRLLLSFMQEEELESVLLKYGYPEPNRWKGAGTKKGLEKILREIRETGRVVIKNDKNGVAQVAFPIRCGQDVVAAVGSPVPQFRFAEKEGFIINMLEKTAEQINRAITEQKKGR